MVNSTQILTVSYGTFSCTLEGFDDPFNSMKSIAEYFRDLAADDRYFGAEPPQPDAEMLHRIAQREVNRRVESHVTEDGMVLRQIGGEAAAAPMTAAQAPAAKVQPAPAAPSVEPRVEVLAPEHSGESVADKLSRIRAAVARARAAEDELAQTYEEDEKVDTGYMGSIDDAFSGPAFSDDTVDEAEAADEGDDETESTLTSTQSLAGDDAADAVAEADDSPEEVAGDEAPVEAELAEIESVAEEAAVAEAPAGAEAPPAAEIAEIEAAGEVAEAPAPEAETAETADEAAPEATPEAEIAEESAGEVEAPEIDATPEPVVEIDEVAAAEAMIAEGGPVEVELVPTPLAALDDVEIAADIAEASDMPAAEIVVPTAPEADAEEAAEDDDFAPFAGADFSAADMAYGEDPEVETEAPAFVAGFEAFSLDGDAEDEVETAESDDDTLAALAAALNPADEAAEEAALDALEAEVEAEVESAIAEESAEPAEEEVEFGAEATDFAAEFTEVADEAPEAANEVAEVATAETGEEDAGEPVSEAEALGAAADLEDAAAAPTAIDELVAAIAEETYGEEAAAAEDADEFADAGIEAAEVAEAEEIADTGEAEAAEVAEVEEAEAIANAEGFEAVAEVEGTDEDRDVAAFAQDAEDDALSTLADNRDAEVESAEEDGDEEIEIEAETDDDDAPHGRIIRLKRRDFEAALAAGEIEEIVDEEDAVETAADEDADLEGIEAAFADIAEEAEDAAEAPDLEEAIAGEAADEEFDADAEDEAVAYEGDAEQLQDDIRSLIGETSLSDEDEEDLLEELASVERDAQAMRPADAEDQDAEEVAEIESEVEAEGDSDEDALNRLLTETNVKLGDSESSRRRSAIAHLKAAVAATRADHQLQSDRDRQEQDAMDQYRDDLAKVVRPRRPAEGGEKPAQRGRPVADILRERTAPLMLVSEQRVDIPEDERHSRTDPVMPRRIAMTEEDEAQADDTPEMPDAPVSFADFAAKAGASELPEILEAATAYATLVEGQEGVSRPAILRRAASLSGEAEISREQGLQSFGMLLRTGRIRKLGQGRFGVAEETEIAKIARAGNE